MIGDPGSGANSHPEPEPPVKLDRIPYDPHRAPSGVVPLVQTPPTPMDIDSEIPLDMTVRRKNSACSDRQPPTGASSVTTAVPPAAGSPDLDASGSASGSINTRPSVITKAPPPPIKKRISSMHSNGEIVIKSSVGDNLSPVNCDVFIEEHFRRSLGNTYASIYGTNNNNNNNNQQKNSGSDTRNSSTSSSSSISSSSSSSSTNSSGSGLSCTSSLTSTSGISSASSSASNLLGPSMNFNFGGHHIPNLSPVPRHNHAIPPVEIPPLIKVKLEPGVLGQTPAPQQPQLVPQPQLIRPEAKIKVEPGTVLHVRPDSEEEVDDHFAKALGNDTWKMIQEKNMNL